MLPTIQFDPSTLVIWTTTSSLLGNAKARADEAVRAAFEGRSPEVAIAGIQHDDPQRRRLLVLHSSVWHEKRHFFDTLLTNYGAMRFRRTFELAANFYPLMVDASHGDRKLWFPVEAYGCPVRRELFGIKLPAPNILEIARHAKAAKRGLYTLDAPARTGGTTLALGGEALLEGLAHTSQLHAIEFRLGHGELFPTVRDFDKSLPREGAYRMIETVAGALGCSKEIGQGVLVLNAGLASAVFVTALCGRYLARDPSDAAPNVQPGPRVTALFSALGPRPGSFEMSDEEAWALVDSTAKRLWGRTAMEEIEADIEGMDRAVSADSASWLDAEWLLSAWTDFIKLRRRILAAAKSAGSAALSPRAFPKLWLSKLHPWRVVASPGGETDPSSTDPIVFERAFNQPRGLEEIVPERVVWGRLVKHPVSREDFAVGDDRAWIQMLERHAPRALLMENGRRHRLMIPPQLERPLEELRSEGFEPCFEPAFEYPEQRTMEQRTQDAIELAQWTGRDSFICDVTGEVISPQEAALLTPWEYRQSGLAPIPEEGLDQILAAIGDAANWSDWIVKRSLLALE